MSHTATLRFAGYAALFDKPDGGGDIIRPGAFHRSLSDTQSSHSAQNLPLFWQHRPDLQIGWIENAAEDDKGLRVIGRIDNPAGAAGLALRQGTVSGLSFGYRTRDSLRTAKGRELLDLDILEVSLVTHPMQHGARVHFISPF